MKKWYQNIQVSEDVCIALLFGQIGDHRYLTEYIDTAGSGFCLCKLRGQWTFMTPTGRTVHGTHLTPLEALEHVAVSIWRIANYHPVERTPQLYVRDIPIVLSDDMLIFDPAYKITNRKTYHHGQRPGI